MPITSWICAACGGREVPLDHFATTSCGEKVHPDYAAAILADRADQYVTGKVRVSHGLGCPRRAAIEESEGFAVDPLDLNSMLTGTAWHAFVERAGPKEWVEVEVSGKLAGVQVAGKMDRLRQLSDGTWAIEDWKHVNDFGVKFISAGPKAEHKIQTSLYAELLEQCGSQRPTVGIIWYHSSQQGKAALTSHKFDLMPTHEALDQRPYDCDYTVAELLKQAASHYEDGIKWQELPLAGKSIKFGTKTACNYCSVMSVCREAEVGAPF
jgi:hypothetical protein